VIFRSGKVSPLSHLGRWAFGMQTALHKTRYASLSGAYPPARFAWLKAGVSRQNCVENSFSGERLFNVRPGLNRVRGVSFCGIFLAQLFCGVFLAQLL